MNDDAVIKVKGLGKRYRLGTVRQAYGTFRDLFSNTINKMAKGKNLTKKSEEKHFWALKGLNFEVKRGEVLGIIGRNGAGKSTLLKILSRITSPTEGRVEVKGRVGTLLEVGTGFHPELTGKENIFLNGAILGMTQSEIKKKFDEIVDFSGVEKFLDTPVKRYSSGMYVRLAFAVAAHLAPEILLVDEVLAVGDTVFQKKCLGKMGEVAQEGRTALFVSHNMAAISTLCNRCLLLESGLVRADLPAEEAVKLYLSESSGSNWAIQRSKKPDKKGYFAAARILNLKGRETGEIICNEPITIEVDFTLSQPVPGIYFTCILSTFDGIDVLMTDNRDISASDFLTFETGNHTFSITIPERLLAPKTYILTLAAAANKEQIDKLTNVCSFAVHDIHTPRGNKRVGFFSIMIPWRRV